MKYKEDYSKIIRHQYYWKIIKGRRSHIGNRWLSYMWPNKKESRILFVPKFAYLNYIGPGDVAGNHFHRNKKEIFCPLGNLTLIIYNKSGKLSKIRMTIGNKKHYIMYYLPIGVPHAVQNDTKSFQPFVVLTNRPDLKSNTIKFKVV